MQCRPARGGICKVAIVDDDPFDQQRIMEALNDLNGSHRIDVKIEKFSDAHTVANAIREDGRPRWDIIIADTLMPHPETGRDEHENGGFHIARALEAKYAGTYVPVKLALISNKPGCRAVQRLLDEFDVPETAYWLYFFPKGESATKMRGAGELMNHEAWKMALLQLVRLRDSELWGLQLLRNHSDTRYSDGIFRSAAAIELLTKAASIGINRSIDVVTVHGETGTGKEAVVLLLHAHRMASQGKIHKVHRWLIPINIGCIDTERVDHILFGSQNGSQAEMSQRKNGLFELTQGTIHIADIQFAPVPLQSKLCDLIDNKKIPKVGSEGNEPAFVGELMIFSTDAALKSVENGGCFISDFLFRIDRERIDVPPLRERREDIVPAAEHFLLECAMPGVTSSLTRDAEEWLLNPSFHWKGNFRMLRNLITRASGGGERETVGVEDLQIAATEIAEFYEQPSAISAPVVSSCSGTAPAMRTWQIPRSEEEWQAMLNACPTGKSYTEWGEKFGLDGDSLRRICERNGWPEPSLTGQRRRKKKW